MYDRSNDKVLLQSDFNLTAVEVQYDFTIILFHFYYFNLKYAMRPCYNRRPLPYTCGVFVKFYPLIKVLTLVLVRAHSAHRARHGASAARALG